MITDDWRRALDKNDVVGVVFAHFRKAFVLFSFILKASQNQSEQFMNCLSARPLHFSVRTVYSLFVTTS